MKCSIKKNLVRVEILGMTPKTLEDFHDFLRLEMISPLGKTEILVSNNGHSRMGVYSGFFTVKQTSVVLKWLRKRKVTIHT